MEHNLLIAYYSHSGNTEKIAELICGETGGMLFKIEPAEPYPASYDAVGLSPRASGKGREYGGLRHDLHRHAKLVEHDGPARRLVPVRKRPVRQNGCSVLHPRGRRACGDRAGYRGAVPALHRQKSLFRLWERKRPRGSGGCRVARGMHALKAFRRGSRASCKGRQHSYGVYAHARTLLGLFIIHPSPIPQLRQTSLLWYDKGTTKGGTRL